MLRRFRHRASLEAYGRAVWKYRHATSATLVLAALGGVAQIFPELRYPFWIWVLAFLIVATVIQFLVFHETRVALLNAVDNADPTTNERSEAREAEKEAIERLIREFEDIQQQVRASYMPMAGGNAYYMAWHPVRIRTLANRDLSAAWIVRHYPSKAAEFDGDATPPQAADFERYMRDRIDELKRIGDDLFG